MTPEEVRERWDKLNAKKRDAWVAEVVMEAATVDTSKTAWSRWAGRWGQGHESSRRKSEYRPTTDIVAAFEVVEKVQCKRMVLEQWRPAGQNENSEIRETQWRMTFDATCAFGPTKEAAICVAALTAKLGGSDA